MRTGLFGLKAAGLVAAMASAALVLGACQQEQKKEETTESTTPDIPAIIASGYDTTPESNQRYLEDNKTKPGVMVTESGLQYRVIDSGSGATPKLGDMVTVTYKGQTIDGAVFDQTPPGQTATFPVGGLIPGWNEALQMMKEGDHWELTIPANLAYGASGAGPIGPDQTLVFDLTLLSVTPQ